jgi:hypothetical protein
MQLADNDFAKRTAYMSMPCMMYSVRVVKAESM